MFMTYRLSSPFVMNRSATVVGDTLIAPGVRSRGACIGIATTIEVESSAIVVGGTACDTGEAVGAIEVS